MKYMTGKAKMMVVGVGIGMAAAALIAALAVSGRIGWPGLLAVLALAFLTGLLGLLVGIQIRVKVERDKAWLKGYKDGMEAGHGITVISCRHSL